MGNVDNDLARMIPERRRLREWYTINWTAPNGHDKRRHWSRYFYDCNVQRVAVRQGLAEPLGGKDRRMKHEASSVAEFGRSPYVFFFDRRLPLSPPPLFWNLAAKAEDKSVKISFHHRS